MIYNKTIKALATAALLAISSTSLHAQDLLARQAPVDRKATKVDTFALKSVIEREQANSAVAQLYTEWNNKYAHRATELPDSFRIDLRHFCMPTPSRTITSNFGRRWGRMHKGLDIKVYTGDTIRAAFDGKVRMAQYDANGYGNYVVIRHPNGLETIYGHMSKHLVNENQNVKAGTPIGLGGNTGRSTGSHLHFETRLCGVALDPALMFDFKAQDVTADYYMFRKKASSAGSSVAQRNTKNNSVKEESQEMEAVENNQASVTTTRETTTRSKKDRKTSRRQKEKSYKVKKGDTLYSIAKRSGMTVDQLCKMNGIKKNKSLQPGQVLKHS
jgi:murein DD-endopeptidase MepM/ murein hydrolase activator NlpD